MLEKGEYDQKIKQLEQWTDKLHDEKATKAASKQLGIIDDEEAGFLSPEKKGSRKVDPSAEEAAKTAKDLAKRMILD